MKNFLIKSILFIAICLTAFYMIFSLADGYADGLYLKFTTPKQHSLVLGTSKATQGIQPSILNKELNRKDIYNYAFTVVHSPYGPYYFESVKRKLDHSERNGVFILQVDPYSISSTTSSEDPENFREKERAVAKIRNVNTSPNIEYLLWHYPYQYSFIFKRRLGSVGKGFSHDDGWLEMTVNMDSVKVDKRIKSKTKAYIERTATYHQSKLRLEYLEKTIKYLQSHGKVYLVRMPLAKPLFDLENVLDPSFDSKMNVLSQKFEIPYFNYSHNYQDYKYSDGNHLSKDSSTKFTLVLAKDISQYRDGNLY